MNHIKIKDIVEHILRRFRFDFWIEEGSKIETSQITRLEYSRPQDWMSIGISEPGNEYRPLWDVYAPNELCGPEVVKGRLKYACLRLGGRYAFGYKVNQAEITTITLVEKDECKKSEPLL